MIKAIIFDVFGVIYPQAVGNFFKDKDHLFKNEKFLDDINVQIDLGIITRDEFFKAIEAETGISAPELQKQIDKQMEADPQLIQLIKELKGQYKIGLLSNAGKEEVEPLYRDKIDSLFDCVCVSYATQLLKPNTEAFEDCAAKLSIAPQDCLFVDDSPMNIEAAQKTGMQALLYPEFGKILSELLQLTRS